MTYTPMPIIIPASDPVRCPECGKVEKKIEVCAHCGHEYKKEPLTTFENILAPILLVLIGVFVVWFVVTVAEWFVSDHSLVEVLKSQWDWAKGLRIF